jgi:hypothetical protein
MFKTLGRITEWGWKTGQAKQEALIKQATRDTPMEHTMFQISPWWAIIMLVLMFGMITIAFAFIGHPLLTYIERLLIGGEGVTNIGLAVYGYYLFWFFPAIFLGTTFVQVLMVIFSKMGNTFTGNDMVKVLAEMEGDTKLLNQAIQQKVPKNIIQEKTKFIDLAWIRRQAVIQMAKVTIVITIVFAPFMYLSINNHFSKLADDTLVYSRFFQLGTETIPVENIDMVKVELDWEDDHLEPYYEIELIDGRTIDLWDIGIAAPDLDKVLEIASYLESQDVFHFIIPLPSMSSLNQKTQNEFTEFYSSLRAL